MQDQTLGSITPFNTKCTNFICSQIIFQAFLFRGPRVMIGANDCWSSKYRKKYVHIIYFHSNLNLVTNFEAPNSTLCPQRSWCVPCSPFCLLRKPVRRSAAATASPRWLTVGDEACMTSPGVYIQKHKNSTFKTTGSGELGQWLSEKPLSSASSTCPTTP